MDLKHSFGEEKERNMMMKPSEGQLASKRGGSFYRFFIIALILSLVAATILLSAGCGKTKSGSTGQQSEVSSDQQAEALKAQEAEELEALNQQMEALEQEREALEQESEALEQEFEELEQQYIAQTLADSNYVGVWELVSIGDDDEWIDVAGTGFQMEYHINSDGTVKVIATGRDDEYAIWEEQKGTLVVKGASGEGSYLTGNINGYGQLIIHNEEENVTAAFEKR